MATSTTLGKAVQASEEITLDDVIEDIVTNIFSDGTLLKSTFDIEWQNMLYALKYSTELKGVKGRPAILDQIHFSSNGSVPTSSRLDEALDAINFIATPVGKLGENGWFLSRAVVEHRSEAFNNRPEEYKQFIEKASAVARRFVSQGNILELLPRPASVNKLRRS
jgi:hypothetical protein